MPAATLDVDTDVFGSASSAFLRANDAVCNVVATLSTAVGEGGGMAGSCGSGAAWAVAYDRAASGALDAGAATVDRLGELGIALATAGGNHRDADALSTPGAPSWSGPSSTPSAGSVIPARPPSAAGGSTPPPLAWSVVAGLLSVAWPDGDPATLRTVAAGWTSAAAAFQSAADGLSGPIGDLAGQRSPEIDSVVARCTAGQVAVRDLADRCASLGGACAALADHVQAARDQLTQALDDARDLVGDGFGVVAAVVSGDDVVAKIQQLVATLSEILDHLRALVADAIAALEDLLGEITSLVHRLADLVTTAVTVAFTIARLAPAAVTGVATTSVPRVDLTAMEGPGEDDGHTIRKHVGKSVAYLRKRAANEQRPSTSTYVDLATAQSVVAQCLAKDAARIKRWLERGRPGDRLPITMAAPPAAGRVYVAATDSFVPPRTVLTILLRTGPGTFIVLTSYLKG